MWNSIRDAALEIIHSVNPDANDNDLNNMIMATGYPGAPEPHASGHDLIYTYAASLRNAGGAGPIPERFGKMVATASCNVLGDQVFNEVTVQHMANACFHYLDTDGVMPLINGPGVDYPGQLAQLAAGEQLDGNPLLPQLMNSVVDFVNLITAQYQGSARAYHNSFSMPHNPDQPYDFLLEKLNEIAGFPRVGVAVGMNFFKDSQVPAFAGNEPGILCFNRIGYFVKPDRHLLRIMLRVTGRAEGGNVPDAELANMNERRAKRMFREIEPADGWPQHYPIAIELPLAQQGKWRCIEDVIGLASGEGVAPLEVDRVLFMIGSGKFPGLGTTPLAQERRYQLLFEAIDENP